jgi:hypothetical protein
LVVGKKIIPGYSRTTIFPHTFFPKTKSICMGKKDYYGENPGYHFFGGRPKRDIRGSPRTHIFPIRFPQKLSRFVWEKKVTTGRTRDITFLLPKKTDIPGSTRSNFFSHTFFPKTKSICMGKTSYYGENPGYHFFATPENRHPGLYP